MNENRAIPWEKFVPDIELLTHLCQVPGLPGREAPVAKVIRDSLASIYPQIRSDPIGNLIVHIGGSGPRLLMMAHMDEVGLIVRRIERDGFLKVERLGGISIRALPGSKMHLWTKSGTFPALVGIPAQHVDQSQPLDLPQIYMDLGIRSAEDAVAQGVQVGDGLTWDSQLAMNEHSKTISGKALDDRLGCYAMIELAKIIQDHSQNAKFDLYLAFTVQEETMLSGVLPVINDLKPDLVIGIDGTLASDTPDSSGMNSDISLGSGPAIKLCDAIRGKMAAYVPDWDLVQSLQKLAHMHHIPIQNEVVTGLSTGLTPVPYSLGSIRTAALSIPIRYHHTAIENAHISDLEQLIKLLDIIVTQLT